VRSITRRAAAVHYRLLALARTERAAEYAYVRADGFNVYSFTRPVQQTSREKSIVLSLEGVFQGSLKIC
jgi:hypothetical protein